MKLMCKKLKKLMGITAKKHEYIILVVKKVIYLVLPKTLTLHIMFVKILYGMNLAANDCTHN